MQTLFSSLINTELEPLILASHTYYGQNAVDRKYHNLFHAHYVVNSVNVLTDFAPSRALTLAALWHDAVYIPGATGDANEICSAQVLDIEFTRLVKVRKYDQISEDAQRLIRNTGISTHLFHERIDGELAYLLDADLSALAAPYDVFLKNQENIILENNGNVAEHSKKSAAFVHMFLWKREFIYHTDEARKLWEYEARKNVTRYCLENGILVNTVS